MAEWRKLYLTLGAAVFLVAVGFAVRIAEDSQVGYTNDFSMWVFVAAGLVAYKALISFFLGRRLARGAKRKHPASGVEGDDE